MLLPKSFNAGKWRASKRSFLFLSASLSVKFRDWDLGGSWVPFPTLLACTQAGDGDTWVLSESRRGGCIGFGPLFSPVRGL